jgi:hypothetical protein
MRDENVRFGRLLAAVWLLFGATQLLHYVVVHYSYTTGYWCVTGICPVVALSFIMIYREVQRYFLWSENNDNEC